MEEYLGFKEVTLSDEELALIYQKAPNYNLGCLENEYLVVHNKSGEIIPPLGIFQLDGSSAADNRIQSAVDLALLRGQLRRTQKIIDIGAEGTAAGQHHQQSRKNDGEG